MLPLAFGLLLMALFIAYGLLLGWLSLFPIFSWHFRIMSKIWLFGLDIVLNGTVWKFALLGAGGWILFSIFK